MQAPKKYMFPSDVFNGLAEIASFHDRVAYLQKHQSYAIRTIIQANFNPHIIFDLPYGSPPFNADGLPAENSLARIDKGIKVLGSLIVQGKPSVGLERIRKETRFLQLIESVNERDAAIIIAMKDKKLTEDFPLLDHALAKAAFPDIVE
jgi:hypothetical protein